MNKNVLKFKLIISVLLVLGMIFFVSCEKEKVIATQESQTIEEYNQTILNVYEIEFNQLNCTKSAELSVTEILETEEGKIQFIEFCSDLKIEIEGDEYIINDYNPALVDELYESTLAKLSHFELEGFKSINTAPTDEEIRDALKEECGQYMFGIDVLCKLAVDIAYVLR